MNFTLWGPNYSWLSTWWTRGSRKIWKSKISALPFSTFQIPYINGLEVERWNKANYLLITALLDENYKIDAYTTWRMDIWRSLTFSLPGPSTRVDSLIERHYGMHDKFCYGNIDVDFDSYGLR